MANGMRGRRRAPAILYSRWIKLPYRGKWRLPAYAPGDIVHTAQWSSGYDYVTVY